MPNIQLTTIKGVENTSTSIAYINHRNSPCIWLFKCTIHFPSGAVRDNALLTSAPDNHVRSPFPFMEKGRSHRVLTEMELT